MARKDALIRLHKRLLARRDALRKALAGQLSDLAKGGATGDIADIAFDIGAGEISSQLAELEARELQLVERALEKLEQGTYGICELCGTKNSSSPSQCHALLRILHQVPKGGRT